MHTNFIRKFDPPNAFDLLYVARYVKENPSESPASSGQYPRYHREIWTILEDLLGKVTVSDTEKLLDEKIADADYIFSLMNRIPMQNGEVYISALCEFAGKPYLGSSPSIRAVAEDKHLAKHLVASLGIDTAPWIVASQFLDLPVAEPFEGPFFVKPRTGAASEHIDAKSLAFNWSDASKRVDYLINLGIEVIIEKFVPGQNVVTALHERSIDMAIMGRPPREPEVLAEGIGVHPHLMIAAPDHKLAQRDFVPPEELLDEVIISLEEGSGTRILMIRYLDRVGEGKTYETLEMGSNETIKQAVIAGLGIALISQHTVTEELKAGRLVAIQTSEMPIERHWFLLHRADQELSPTMEQAWNFIKSNSA